MGRLSNLAGITSMALPAHRMGAATATAATATSTPMGSAAADALPRPSINPSTGGAPSSAQVEWDAESADSKYDQEPGVVGQEEDEGFFTGGGEGALLDALGQPRRCLRINARGQAKEVEVTRHQLVERLGIPYRDVCTVDYLGMPRSHVGQETFLVSRGRALLLVLEGTTRALVTSRYALFFSAPPPPAPRRASQPKLSRRRAVGAALGVVGRSPGNGGATDQSGVQQPMTQPQKQPPSAASVLQPPTTSPPSPHSPLIADVASRLRSASASRRVLLRRASMASVSSAAGSSAGSSVLDGAEMPFEFVVLEACLSAALKALESQVLALERGAGPLVEMLSLKVNRNTLEGVRSVKQHLYRLMTRVDRLIEELADVMDDDEELGEWYLSRREAASACAAAAAGEGSAAACRRRMLAAMQPEAMPGGSDDDSDALSWQDGAQPMPYCSSADSLCSLSSTAGPMGNRVTPLGLGYPLGPSGSASPGHEGEWLSWRALQAQFKSLGFSAIALRPRGLQRGWRGDGSSGGGGSGSERARRGRRKVAAAPPRDPNRPAYRILEVLNDISDDEAEEEEDEEEGYVEEDSRGGSARSRRTKRHTLGRRAAASRLPVQLGHILIGTVVEREVVPRAAAAGPVPGRGAETDGHGAGGAASAQSARPPQQTAADEAGFGAAADAGKKEAAAKSPAGDRDGGDGGNGGSRGGGGGAEGGGGVRLMDVMGQLNQEVLEDLLEFYFTLAELLKGRLVQLKERIDDTEDLVNIELDHRRNELVGLQLVATIAAVGLGIVASVAGIFGMNLQNQLEDSFAAFVAVAASSAALCALVIAAFLWYAHHRGLMFIPDPQVLRSE